MTLAAEHATTGATPPARRSLKPLKGLIPFLKPYKARIVGAGVALIVAAALTLALGRAAQWIVDHGLTADDLGALDYGLALFFPFLLLLAGATYARFFLVTWVGERVVADLRKAVYDHLLKLDVGFYESARTGEIASRLTADTTLIQTVIGSSASMALRHALTVVGAFAMLLLTSPKLTGLVALVVPLTIAPILIFGRRVRRLSRASQDRVADVSAHAEESLSGIRTVQAFTQEPRESESFAGRAEDAFNVAIARTRARALLIAIVICAVFGAVGIVFWIGGHDVIAGAISPGEFVAFIIYAVFAAGSVGAVSEVFGDFQRAAGATERLMELLDVAPAIAPAASSLSFPDAAKGRVSFDDVVFHYPSRPRDAALDGFSLEVEPGETVALVGPSGAGKSTVFQLLLRFYDPQAGAVRVDGVDVRDVDPAELRRRVGLVAQDPTIFGATARENIRYGRPDATDAEVEAAARAAYAYDFLRALPDGFDTHLGARGVRLSGGQRQRIAIARVILRDPEILLLDEATSALDAESERAVQMALENLSKNRTTLVIAHRLATVLSADRIAVMDGGRVVELGSHAQLTAQGGLYARLAALQFDVRPTEEQTVGSASTLQTARSRL